MASDYKHMASYFMQYQSLALIKGVLPREIIFFLSLSHDDIDDCRTAVNNGEESHSPS